MWVCVCVCVCVCVSFSLSLSLSVSVSVSLKPQEYEKDTFRLLPCRSATIIAFKHALAGSRCGGNDASLLLRIEGQGRNTAFWLTGAPANPHCTLFLLLCVLWCVREMVWRQFDCLEP